MARNAVMTPDDTPQGAAAPVPDACRAAARMKLMLDAAPLGCILWARTRRVIDCNAAALEMFGLADKADFIDKFSGYTPEYQPDGQRSLDKARAILDKALAGERSVFEWMHLAADGTLLPAEVVLTPIRRGSRTFVAGYLRDLREHRRMALEIERRSLLLRAVNELSAAILQTDVGGLEAALGHALGIVAKAADVDRVYVWKNFVRDGQRCCTRIHEWPETVEARQGKDLAVESAYGFVAGWEEAFLARRCINSPVRALPIAGQRLLRPRGVLSILLAPIFIKEVFWGFIGFDDCRRERIFSECEEAILRFVSEMFANTLIRSEEAALVRRADEHAKLMLNATPLGCVLWNARREVIDCNEAMLKMLGIRDKAAFLDRRADYSPEYQPDGRRSREKMFAMVDTALDAGRCVFDWTHQTRNGTLIPAEITLVRVQYGDSWLVPGYTRDLRVVRQLETNILHLESEVEKIYYDPLTGIYNRRFFDESMGRLIAGLSRSGNMLSLLMVDIDHFKLYNDIYGHPRGDSCLRRVAEALRDTVTRADDFVARYGGEEFVVVLPNTGESGACTLARRLLKNVLRCAIPHAQNGAESRVTISIGVTSGQAKHTCGAQDFIQRADTALYASKRDGRNRHTFAAL